MQDNPCIFHDVQDRARQSKTKQDRVFDAVILHYCGLSMSCGNRLRVKPLRITDSERDRDFGPLVLAHMLFHAVPRAAKANYLVSVMHSL